VLVNDSGRSDALLYGLCELLMGMHRCGSVFSTQICSARLFVNNLLCQRQTKQKQDTAVYLLLALLQAIGIVLQPLPAALGPHVSFVRQRAKVHCHRTAMMQLRTLAFLVALVPAAALLAPTPSPLRATRVSAKKKSAVTGGFGASAPATPKKKKKDVDEPALARPWDAPDDDDDDTTRAQKRGTKNPGKKGMGPTANPSGGMSAGVKLK